MKRFIVMVSLLAVAVMAAGLLSGCEDSLVFPDSTTTTVSTSSTTSTSTSSTTTGTVSSSIVNSSKGGAMFASSGNGVAGVASGSQVSASSASAFDVRTASVPSTFFSAPDANGYVTVTGFGTNQTVEVRYIMASGNPVDPAFLATKGLAVMGTFDWDTMFTGASPSVANIAAFIATPTHEALTTIADYINWDWTAGIVWEGIKISSPSCPDLRNPTPEASDLVARMEGTVTIFGTATGTLDMTITVKATEEFGLPTGATGSGTIEIGSITLETTMEVVFTSGGTNESLSLTGTSDDGHTVAITMAADGSGTGTVTKTSTGDVATIVITAAGVVTVTDSLGNTETFNL